MLQTRCWEGLEVLEPRIVLAAVHWDGDGGDLSWQNPLNWSGDVVPGALDDVTITAPGQVIEFDQAETAVIRSLLATAGLALRGGGGVGGGGLDVVQGWNQTGKLVIEGGSLKVWSEWRQRGDVMLTSGSMHSLSNFVHVGALVMEGGSLAVRDAWRSGSLEVSGGDVRIDRLWIQNGAMSFSGGTIRGGMLAIPAVEGTLSLNGEMHWTGGAFETMTVQVRPGMRMLIEGDVALDRSVLVNRGLVTWRSGDITTFETAIWNLEGHRFNMQSAGFLGGASAASSRFVNLGEIWRNGTGGSASRVQMALDNQGTVDVRHGTLDLQGSIDQLLENSSNGSATLRGGTWKVSSTDSRLEMPREISVLGGWQLTTFNPNPGSPLPGLTLTPGAASGYTVVELHGAGAAFPALESIHAIFFATLKLSGGRQFTFTETPYASIPPGFDPFGNSGTIIIDNPGLTVLPELRLSGRFEIMQGTVRFTGGMLADLYIGAGAQVIAAAQGNRLGNVSGPGLLRLAGDTEWQRGELTGGPLIIEEGVTLTLTGEWRYRSFFVDDKVLARRTLNFGTIDWQDPEGAWYLESTLGNHGTLLLNATNRLGTRYGANAVSEVSHIVNFGTIRKVGNWHVTFRGGEQNGGGTALINAGVVHVEGGWLGLAGGVSNSGASSWQLDLGSELRLMERPAHLSSTTITGAGLLRVSGPVNWSGATRTGGPIAVAPPGRLHFHGNATVAPTGFVNNGRITLTPGAQVVIAPTVGSFDQLRDLRLEPGSLLTIAGPGYFGPQATTTTVLAGTAPEEFGRIETTRPRRLFEPFWLGGGSLFAEFAPGFGPEPGVTFDFMSLQTLQGNFDLVAAENAPPGRGIVLEFVGLTGRLRVT